MSWHTWSPGCGVHPLGGVLRRGPPWPGLALAPGGEPVGAGARSWSSGRGVESNTGRWGVHALGRYCVRSRWGSVGRFASLPLLLGLPNALGCRRWGAGCRRRLSTLRLSSLRRPGEPGDRAGSSCRNCIPALISLHYHRSPQPPVLYYCHCRFALS